MRINSINLRPKSTKAPNKKQPWILAFFGLIINFARGSPNIIVVGLNI
jgi:hypothetical protein